MWRPAAKSTVRLYFQLGDKPTFALGANERVAAFADELGLSKKDLPWVNYALSSSKFAMILEAIEAKLPGSGLTMSWIIEESAPAAPDGWYSLLVGGAEADDAIHLRKSLDFGHIRFGEELGYSYAYLGTDRFIEVVRTNKLRGLEWLPLPPAGKRRQDGWWEVFATQPMGRGLDHAAVDTEVINQGWSKLWQCDPVRRWGISEASGDRLDSARVRDPLVLRLLRLGAGTLRGPARFVREHLPEADFAYAQWSSKKDDRAKHRTRSLLCSARAVEVLVAAGVIRKTHIEPVAIVSAEEAENPILDRIVQGPLPRPTLTSDELEAERRRRLALAEGIPVIRPRVRPVQVDDAKSLLDEAARMPGRAWRTMREAGMNIMESSALWNRVPAAWLELAPLLPVELVDPEDTRARCWLLRAPERPVLSGDVTGPKAERPSARDIVIGESEFGDWYAVREGDSNMPKDATVRLWSHETLCIMNEWGSVPEFAAYLCEIARESDQSPRSA